jgi:hypothetical protein
MIYKRSVRTGVLGQRGSANPLGVDGGGSGVDGMEG